MGNQLRALVIVGAMLALAACGGGADTTTPEPPTSDNGATEAAGGEEQDPKAALKATIAGKKVVIGTSGSNNNTLMSIVKAIEIMREEYGLEVDFRQLDSDPLVAATIAGDVDVGELSFAGLADAVTAGAEFIAFGGGHQKNNYIVMSKGDVGSLEDVKGQPFAATQSLNQITGQTARKCLETVGFDIEKDVQLLKLGNTGEVARAVQAGQVVAGISATHRYVPLILEEGEGSYKILCKGWEVNPQMSSVYYASKKWVEENPDIALALNIASIEANRWMQDNKEEWVAFSVANIENMTEDIANIDFDLLVNELDTFGANGTLDRELLQTTLDTSREFGVLEGDTSVDDLATFEYQERALEILGRI